jgi:hypothetical protein
VIHLVFNRPSGHLKIFRDDGSPWDTIDAGGDAWGSTPQAAPYGFYYPIRPGHYVLQAPLRNAPPLEAEGAWKIPVVDIDAGVVTALVNAGRAAAAGPEFAIGHITLPVGNLARDGRTEVLIHGGGSNLRKHGLDPFGAFQKLTKTHGCTRVHNADLARLAAFVQGALDGNTIVYSVVGDPITLPY